MNPMSSRQIDARRHLPCRAVASSVRKDTQETVWTDVGVPGSKPRLGLYCYDLPMGRVYFEARLKVVLFLPVLDNVAYVVTLHGYNISVVVFTRLCATSFPSSYEARTRRVCEARQEGFSAGVCRNIRISELAMQGTFRSK